jgi:ATP synthase protein I
MKHEPPGKAPPQEPEFVRQVGEKAARKLKAKRRASQSIWFGFGMMGMIGWSVVVPTLLGAGLGVWLDKRHPGHHSWTLMLLAFGLVIGCMNAWHWVSKENEEMREDEKEKKDE